MPLAAVGLANPETGRPYSEDYLVEVLQTAARRAGIIKRKPPIRHDLRGTFAMHRAMAGVSFMQLEAELGHDSPGSIRNYLAESKHFAAKDSIFFGVDITAGWRERV